MTELCEGRSDKTKKMEWFGNDIQYPVLEFLNWSLQTDIHLGGHPRKNKPAIYVDCEGQILSIY